MSTKNYIPALRFHWLTKIYDRLMSSLMPEKKFKSALIQNANIQNDFSVLDFGVGTATLSIMAYNHNPHAAYTGIDIDEKVLKIAKAKIEKQNSRINLLKYNGGKLPFEDNSFDRVISSLVIHHLTTDPKVEALHEIKRVLKPGAELHIADWGKPSNILMRWLFHIVQLLDGYRTTTDNVKGKIPVLLNNAGFDSIFTSRHFNTITGTIELFNAKK